MPNEKQQSEKEDIESKVLGYFDQQVLASYINESDKYEVTTDYLSGKITNTEIWYKENVSNEEKLISIRFGYRSLINGEIAIVAFLPDLFEKSKFHIPRWKGFFLDNPTFSRKKDIRFEMWKETYLEGSWKYGDTLITRKLINNISLCNGLCEECTGKLFFKYGNLEKINFPIAENDHQYQDSIAILYGFLIDGINIETLSLLSKRWELNVEVKGDRTITELKKILPELKKAKKFNDAISLLRKQRAKATHGVRKNAIKFKATLQFKKDLELINSGICELIRILERKLKMDSRNASNRIEAKKMLPRIVKGPEPNFSICQAKNMINKQIANVEFGSREYIEHVHESEVLIITFTDGSILGIDTGSNIQNIINQSKLKPSDFHVDFNLSWVPKKSNRKYLRK